MKLDYFFDNQYGFRPKHCTEYAAPELVDNIINHKTKMRCQFIYFLTFKVL